MKCYVQNITVKIFVFIGKSSLCKHYNTCTCIAIATGNVVEYNSKNSVLSLVFQFKEQLKDFNMYIVFIDLKRTLTDRRSMHTESYELKVGQINRIICPHGHVKSFNEVHQRLFTFVIGTL